MFEYGRFMELSRFAQYGTMHLNNTIECPAIKVPSNQEGSLESCHYF